MGGKQVLSQFYNESFYDDSLDAMKDECYYLWSVKIRSTQEEEFLKICVGSDIICLKP